MITTRQGSAAPGYRWALVAHSCLAVACGGGDASGPQPGYPNEPPGFVTFAEHSFSGLPPTTASTTGPGILNGWWWRVSSSNLTTASDAGGQSGPGVLRTQYPAGHAAGTAPVNAGGWDPGAEDVQKQKVYMSFWIKIAGSSFETHAAGVKQGFLGVGEDPIGPRNQFFFIFNGSGIHNDLLTEVTLRGQQQNVVTRNLQQNTSTQRTIRAGQWHHVEAVFELNTIGQSNGIFRMWIDETLVCDYTDVVWRTASHTNGFMGYKWNPTWGGSSTEAAKTRDDFILIDHIYFSGVP